MLAAMQFAYLGAILNCYSGLCVEPAGEVARHRGSKRRPADQHAHAAGRTTKKHRRLSRRIAAANDDRFGPFAIARLDFGRSVINAGAFKVGQAVERRPTVLHTGRDYHCPGTDALSVVEGGAEALIRELLKERH